jgi:hypothetical protein
MAFKGMNPEEGREVAQEILKAGEQVLEHIDAVTNVVNSVEWVGPDYDAYREDWNAFVNGPVSDLVEAFKVKGDELNKHAEEQDTTSNQN